MNDIVQSLAAALRLYVKLDNDRRAGAEINDEDWAVCHQCAMTALSEIPSPVDRAQREASRRIPGETYEDRHARVKAALSEGHIESEGT